MKKSQIQVSQGELQSVDEQLGEQTSLTTEQLDAVAGGFSVAGAIYGFVAHLRQLFNS